MNNPDLCRVDDALGILRVFHYGVREKLKADSRSDA